MSDFLFFQESPIVRVIGNSGRGLTSKALIGSVSPWIKELMGSLPQHWEHCIILPDIPGKDISGFLDSCIQNETSLEVSADVVDILKIDTAGASYNFLSRNEVSEYKNLHKEKLNDLKESQALIESDLIKNLKQEESRELTVKKDEAKSLNASVNQNDFYEKLLNTIVQSEEVQRESSINYIKKEDLSYNSEKQEEMSLITRPKNGRKSNVHKEIILNCENCELYFSTKLALERHKRMQGHATLKRELKPIKTKTKYSKRQLNRILKSSNIDEYDLDKIEGLISCDECNKKSASLQSLKIHKEKQHSVYHSCDYCEYSTKEERELQIHRLSVHGDDSLPCNMCDKKYKTSTILYRHKKTDHEGVRFPCDQCDYKAKSSQTLKLHFNSIHEKITVSCDICAKVYTHPRNLHQHKLSVHQGVVYMCDQCDYKGTQKRNLQCHIETVHDSIRHPCDQCEYRGTTKRKLRRHIQSRHNGTLNIAISIQKQGEIGTVKGETTI